MAADAPLALALERAARMLSVPAGRCSLYHEGRVVEPNELQQPLQSRTAAGQARPRRTPHPA
eukprot:7381317-Prymnesium_polylepis.1